MTRAARLTFAFLALSIFATSSSAQQYDVGRLYARVVTMDGDTFEGFIRWDQNEGHWADIIDASKRIPRRFYREADALSGRSDRDRDRGIRIMGLRINSEQDNWPSSATSTVRLGHISKLHVLDDDFALLTLKSGEEQELRRSSTDLGRGNRGIVVKTPAGQSTELEWDDIDFLEFLPAPAETSSPFGARLFGTLETRSGDEFTGWITWDMDEIYADDVLDGRDGRSDVDLPFGSIEALERASSSRTIVRLRNGEETELRGTNDVNSGNRGIAVGDPALGQVRMDWDQFKSVRFFDPPRDAAYEQFDRQWRLNGTVHTEDGESFAGTIRWDNDEEWSWEMLDGDYEGIEFDVEFGLIRTITKASSRSVEVTLLDGRTFTLRNSNDVNDGNKGIFIYTADGEVVLIDWDEFERVEFRG